MPEARERAALTEQAPSAPGPLPLPPPEKVLVRYGELALKGGNRRQFEEALARNIRFATRRIAPVQVDRQQGRFLVAPERRAEEVARRLQEVFGIKSVSPVWSAPRDPDAVATLARAVLLDALASFPPAASAPHPGGGEITFRVQTTRSDKSFPMTSNEFDRYIAERVLPGLDRIRVKLDDPALCLGIEVRRERTYVFLHRLPGPGGLPVGTLGEGLCLLSGGIDSPVAAWMSMKRGLRVSFVTFHSWPFIGDASKRKVIDLVQALARWQEPLSRLFVIPFAEIQTAIRDGCPESYRTVLYRRMMQRIADGIAGPRGMGALITGESLGQVASQTLENIACIEAASPRTVLRPLIGFDKEETIAIARRIGTFGISARQEPDCCTLFLSSKPVIRGRIDACRDAEAKLDVEGLVFRALSGVETIEIESE